MLPRFFAPQKLAFYAPKQGKTVLKRIILMWNALPSRSYSGVAAAREHPQRCVRT